MITELEFQSLAAQGFNRIPLIAEAFADLETPLSLYLKLAGGARHSFLLESVVGGERFGRYSFIGLPARTLVRASGFGADAVTEVVTDGVVVETVRHGQGDHRPEQPFVDLFGELVQAVVAAGGTLSHHHGVGRSKAPAMRSEQGTAIDVVRDLKRVLDPKGIFNRGALIPDLDEHTPLGPVAEAE